MKNSKIFLLPLCGTLILTSGLRTQAGNQPAAGTVTPQPATVQSVFTLPATYRDGRDPFYPESTRVFESEVSTSRTVEITSLKVPGISGRPGHLLAIINNHTFAVNEEGDVKTDAGTVHLHCLDIQPTFVVVEMNGHVHRISVDNQ